MVGKFADKHVERTIVRGMLVLFFLKTTALAFVDPNNVLERFQAPVILLA